MQVHNKKGIIFPFFFLYFYNFQMLEVMSDLETKGGGSVVVIGTRQRNCI